MREKAILKSLAGFPFLINLKMSFMDKTNLYFVFEHCMYGTLSNLITKQGRLSEELCRIYASELVLGLKYLHGANVMHRDLKPENVLIEENLHLKIVSLFLILMKVVD
jgi:serine/threonine protein kinase